MMIPREHPDIMKKAEEYFKKLMPTNKNTGEPTFESRRLIFLKRDYISGLSGLIGACDIFLEKAEKNWNEKLEKYGKYLLTRLDEITDESWRFEGNGKNIIKNAYNTLKKLQKTIKEAIDTKGKINKDQLKELQKETDNILLKLQSIEKELALYA